MEAMQSTIPVASRPGPSGRRSSPSDRHRGAAPIVPGHANDAGHRYRGIAEQSRSTARSSEGRKAGDPDRRLVHFARAGQDNRTAHDRHVDRNAQDVSRLRSSEVRSSEEQDHAGVGRYRLRRVHRDGSLRLLSPHVDSRRRAALRPPLDTAAADLMRRIHHHRWDFQEAIVIKSSALADAVTKIVYFSLIVAALVFVSMLLLTRLHP